MCLNDVNHFFVAELESGLQIMAAEENQIRTSLAAFAVNRKGRIVAWNKAAEMTFGFPKSSALDQCCWELLSGRDIFGNPFCCEGCPLHAAAFNNVPINRFKMNFTTAIQEHKLFVVNTFMLFNRSGKNALVHLCRPKFEVSESDMPQQPYSNPQNKSLTPRETEVLALLHRGMNISEIADAMSVSLFTVRNHCQHIFSKLHVHRRFEAVAIGRKLKLI
jgi:DNA-binding CsgD family transcriptional regulator